MRTTIPGIYTKGIFPTAAIYPIQRLLQGTRELWSLVRNDIVLISSCFLKVWTEITGLPLIAQALKIGVLQVVVSDEDVGS